MGHFLREFFVVEIPTTSLYLVIVGVEMKLALLLIRFIKQNCTHIFIISMKMRHTSVCICVFVHIQFYESIEVYASGR